MMRLVLTGIFVSTAGFGQSVLDSARIPFVAKYFDRQAGERPLRCEVHAIPPRLNFSFRFQAGYVVRVPMKQYFGPKHGLVILARVTPEGRTPVVLGTSLKFPDIPKTKAEFDLAGTYLVGEGHYTVDWLLFDDSNRVCRKSWSVEARLASSERGLKLGIAPATVEAVSFRRWSPQDNHADVAHPIRRLTVLLHAAPIVSRMTRLRGTDRATLLGSLATLLESLPAQSVRLVVFNLDQQQELFRQDVLTPDAFDQVAESINGLQLQLVNYRVLRNRRGHVSLLADLVNQELNAREPSDAVIFLGPSTRYFDKLRADEVEPGAGSAPRFFYLQYKPYWRSGADFPDSIEFATRKVRGKTMLIHTADEFAKAIKQIQVQVSVAN